MVKLRFCIIFSRLGGDFASLVSSHIRAYPTKEIYKLLTRKINKLGFQTAWSLSIQYLLKTILCIFV